MPAKKTDIPEAPHGRKVLADHFCGQCSFIDTFFEKSGLPPGISCRLGRGVGTGTPACDQYKGRGAKIDRESAGMKKARKKLGFRRRKLRPKLVGDCLTTGSHYLDLVTGGGIPGGKLVVYFGPEHSGKTTLCFQTMAATLESGIPVDAWDAEESWDKGYMLANRVDPEHELFTMEAHDNGDDYYNYLVYLLNELEDQDEGGPPQMLIVCDSAAALIAKMTADDPEKENMAGPAGVHSRGLRKIKRLLGRKNVSMIFTNHTGEKPGVSFGNPEYEKGGNALKFYSDIRVRVAKRSSNGQGNTQLPYPNFRSADKGGLVKERSWTGKGKDRYGYAHLSIRKNKGFSGGHQAFMRINTSTGGGPGVGLDIAYDIFQCLIMTGQAEWLGKQRISLHLHNPVFKDGEMKYPRIRGYYDVSMDWTTFCELIHNGGKGKKKGPNLVELWRRQTVSGFALQRFFEAEAEK